MGQRRGPRLTLAEKTELWRRWRRVCSALGSQPIFGLPASRTAHGRTRSSTRPPGTVAAMMRVANECGSSQGVHCPSGPSNETGMGFLLWAGVGASVGYLAAQRRGFSPTTGVVAGLVLGPLAVVLFVVPLPGSGPVHQPQKCPYCAGGVGSDTRVCHHCGAILASR